LAQKANKWLVTERKRDNLLVRRYECVRTHMHRSCRLTRWVVRLAGCRQ